MGQSPQDEPLGSPLTGFAPVTSPREIRMSSSSAWRRFAKSYRSLRRLLHKSRVSAYLTRELLCVQLILSIDDASWTFILELKDDVASAAVAAQSVRWALPSNRCVELSLIVTRQDMIFVPTEPGQAKKGDMQVLAGRRTVPESLLQVGWAWKRFRSMIRSLMTHRVYLVRVDGVSSTKCRLRNGYQFCRPRVACGVRDLSAKSTPDLTTRPPRPRIAALNSPSGSTIGCSAGLRGA